MDKVRLDYFLSIGGSLVEDDEHIFDGFSVGVCSPELMNSPNGNDKDVILTSFTDRENKGVQPVPDGFPVVVINSQGGEFEHIAGEGDVSWGSDCIVKIITWKPDYDKLLEMQKEHDKEQLKKDSKNGVHGEILTPNCRSSMKEIRSFSLESDADIEELMINAKESKMNNVFTQEMKDSGVPPAIGMEVKLLNKEGFEIEYGKNLIGQAVKVLSSSLPVSGSVSVQAVEFGGSCYCFRSSMLHPVKSKEELELEEAKDNQIDKIKKEVGHYYGEYDVEGFLLLMQEKWMLAEIVLPLEVE